MYQGDWSTLPVDKAWNDFQSQDTAQFTPGGAVLQTPNGKFERGEFGKYSGITQNPDGTYKVGRLRDNKTSDNDYEYSQYKLETGPDGKQQFVQVSDWTPENRNSGWEKNLKAAAGMGAVMLGGAAMGGAFGGGSGLLGGSASASPGVLGGSEMGGLFSPNVLGGSGSLAGTDVLGGYGLGGYEGVAGTAGLGGIGSMDVAGGFGVNPLDLVSGALPDASSKLPAGLLDALKNPALAKLVGPLIGGLLAKEAGGGSGGSAQPRMNMAPQAMTQQAPTLRPMEPSVGLPSGLGSQSAGLFDEYLKKQLNGGRRTYYAPTFGAKP